MSEFSNAEYTDPTPDDLDLIALRAVDAVLMLFTGGRLTPNNLGQDTPIRDTPAADELPFDWV